MEGNRKSEVRDRFEVELVVETVSDAKDPVGFGVGPGGIRPSQSDEEREKCGS